MTVSVEGQNDVSTQFAYSNNARKIIAVPLDKAIQGFTSVRVTVKNGVSSRFKDYETFVTPSITGIKIGPMDTTGTICLRNMSEPAAEVDQACHLVAKFTEGIEWYSQSAFAEPVFEVIWFVDDAQMNVTQIHNTNFDFQNAQAAAYERNTVRAVLQKWGREPEEPIEDSIEIETVPVLEWNGIVDVRKGFNKNEAQKEWLLVHHQFVNSFEREHPYSKNKDSWEQGIFVYDNDCLDFFINVTNADDFRLEVNFTIESVDEYSNVIITEEYPNYKSGDIMQHQFKLIKQNRGEINLDAGIPNPPKLSVSVTTRNKARTYVSQDTKSGFHLQID